MTDVLIGAAWTLICILIGAVITLVFVAVLGDRGDPGPDDDDPEPDPDIDAWLQQHVITDLFEADLMPRGRGR